MISVKEVFPHSERFKS